ncbi:MAG: MBL fold metallo-hydrolase [Planctomycetes bacterium]|nr:MBL fold metallo-hydrolase [Planctomycetota bacterium]
MKSSYSIPGLLLILLQVFGCRANERAEGHFPGAWIDGRSESEPAFQVHAYDENTYILRQSLRTDREAPFLYLIFGDDRALLEDTGAGKADAAGAVMAVVEDWKKKHHKNEYPLIVCHSHGHGDHVAGDADFTKIQGVTVIGRAPADVAAFFKIKNWPADAADFDLGGRMLRILPIPGHEAASIAIYDERDQLLLTGDTLYPGRIYVDDFKTLLASSERLVQFTENRPVRWVLGTHIEMTTTPKQDFPFTALQREHEHVLQLERKHILQMRDELVKMREKPATANLDDFIIYILPPRKPKAGK